MKIKAYEKFKKFDKKLPVHIQKKVDINKLNYWHKILSILLYVLKKIKGAGNIWELRVDINYKLTFEIETDTIFLNF